MLHIRLDDDCLKSETVPEPTTSLARRLDTASLGAGGTSRRDALRGGAALAMAAGLAITVSETRAQATGGGFDPQQRFLQLAGGGNGQIFAVQADGTLLWYRHTGWATGTGGWASGSGRTIGSGWHSFQTVMGSTDGSLYALTGDGALYHYRYALQSATTGAGTWVVSKQIGSGFGKFARVFGFNGDVYGVTASGDLYWYEYSSSAGQWVKSSGQLLSGNFKTSVLYADALGVIYAYRFGKIYWHRHLADGSWVGGSGNQIGSGFSELAIHGLQFLGQGSIYATTPTLPDVAASGPLLEYRLTNYSTAGSGPAWANGARASQIGSGWTFESQAALQGYAITRSLTQGETLSVAVSSSLSTYSWSLVRVGTGPSPVLMRGPFSQAGSIQRLPVGFLTSGCGWQPQIRFTIPTDWSPGLYAVRLEGPRGLRRYVPFVVKPATISNAIAVILPTNTAAAYNTWGGHSQYCGDLTGVRQLTLDRPSTEHAVEATGLVEHTLWSDVMLLQWLSSQGLAADCYNDPDLHDAADWLAKYKVVVLGSHPEYWTEQMRQNVLNFLAGGGRLIYSGGNGVYERVTYDSAMSTVFSRRTDGSRVLFTDVGEPASQLLGVNYRSDNWFTFAPYVVSQDHPILAGTGLTTGSSFGATGYNGGASGWETDGFMGLDGEAKPSEVIAVGSNSGGGAHMVLHDTASGGFVFSASSIAFNGALSSDPAMSKLFRNVFDKALAAPVPQPTVTPQKTVAPAPAQPEVAPVN